MNPFLYEKYNTELFREGEHWTLLGGLGEAWTNPPRSALPNDLSLFIVSC